MGTILIVGAAATGRVPMTAALLERLIAQRGLSWIVVAAGVVGHDDAPAEPEARDAMMTLGLNIGGFRAQSLTDEMAHTAAVLLAVDSGIARVIAARYPDAIDRTVNLGELAGRQRNIPDPFRMQVGAWITYAREIDALLRAGLERLTSMVGDPGDTPTQNAPGTQPSSPRAATLVRCARLLDGLAAGTAWAEARPQLDAALATAAELPLAPGDLAAAYVALLRALLTMTSAAPTPGQIRFLNTAIGRLQTPIDQQAISDLSATMGVWAGM